MNPGPRFISFVTDETAARTGPRIDLALQPDTIEEQSRATSRRAESHCFPRTSRAATGAARCCRRVPVYKGFTPTRGQPPPSQTSHRIVYPPGCALRRECGPYHAVQASGHQPLLRHATRLVAEGGVHSDGLALNFS
jgi:hypothetical protein